jgi:hypothetical protein
MNRLVQPEWLDELPPADPHAVRSRRDLRRVNAWMRNHAIMARALRNNFDFHAPRQIIELGAGDGDFLLGVVQRLGALGVPPSGGSDRLKPGPQTESGRAFLLDRQNIVSAETLAAFTRLGWRAETVVADVFDWPQASTEVVVANLFLHHFEDARLAELLQKVSTRARLFVAIEPHRFRYPFLCGQLLRLIGCNAVTRHDAAVSIRAGFLGNELSALWPDRKNWRLTERRTGLFSHLFVAKRIPDAECADMSALSKAATCRRNPK